VLDTIVRSSSYSSFILFELDLCGELDSEMLAVLINQSQARGREGRSSGASD
jgi:hypothetical protein